VQTLVLRRRGEFRLDLKVISITDRPNAVYALRQYLTMCTPFAIETDINSTITVFQQVGSGGLDQKGPLFNTDSIGKPFTSATSIGTAPVRRQDQPRNQTIEKLVVNYDPKRDTVEHMASLARKLCLPDFDVKNPDKMAAGIQVYQMTQRDVLNLSTTKVTGKLADKEILDLEDAAKCDSSKFQNYYEASPGIPGGINNVDVVTLLNRALKKDRRLVVTPPQKPTEAQIRAKITEVQQSLPKLTLRSPELAGQLTPDLIGTLQNTPDPTQ
jgi:hypothetical protein